MTDSLMITVLESTAWKMETPQMYGAFHIIFSAVLIILAAAGAVRAGRLSVHGRIRLLTVCGWILIAMEVYKQLFLYHIVNGGVYDWWYFPFQLCSVPMYLCVLLPLLTRSGTTGKICSAVLTFLASYSFLGAAATFAVPEDILRPYVVLTVHGFVWHGILMFISLTIFLSGMADLSLRGFIRSSAIFLVMCAAAVCINIAAEPAMAASHAAGLLPNSYAAMFYLNPYHISPQPVVDAVQKSAGIPLGLALYVIAIIAASGITDLVFRKYLRDR